MIWSAYFVLMVPLLANSQWCGTLTVGEEILRRAWHQFLLLHSIR